jgi:hypothetical protein
MEKSIDSSNGSKRRCPLPSKEGDDLVVVVGRLSFGGPLQLVDLGSGKKNRNPHDAAEKATQSPLGQSSALMSVTVAPCPLLPQFLPCSTKGIEFNQVLGLNQCRVGRE